MKTQQEQMQAYWGPGGTVDMVKEYNAKHGCDVKPWECVKWRGISSHDDHPGFNDSDYTLAIAILYDDKRKEHRPVFVGSKLYYKTGDIVYTVMENGLSPSTVMGIIPFDDLSDMSWNPPKPKRTFKINDLELPCPVRKGEGEYVSSVCGIEYYFTDYNDRNKVASAIANILTAARDKE